MRGVDVLVVGAGPAGLMAGLTLSRAGVSVVILEKRERPDLPVACGEAVSRWFFERFNFSPRSSWVKATVSRLEMIMPGEGMFYAPYPGYSLDRRAFEAHLVAEYQEAGGILNRGDSFLDASRKGKGWEVTTSQGKWKVAVLLGCDGPRSRVASSLGWRKRQWLLAIQYKFPFNPYPGNALRFYYTSDLPRGYLYLFPRGDEMTVGVVGLRKGSYLRGYLEGFLEKEGVDPSRKVCSVAGLIPLQPLLWPPGGEGCLLCGDAAGFVHPMTKGGIHLACYSGEAAARALLSTDVEKWGGEEPLKRYMAFLRDVNSLRPSWYTDNVDLSLLPDPVLEEVGRAMDQKPYFALPVGGFLKRPRLFPWIPRLLRIQWRYRSSCRWGW